MGLVWAGRALLGRVKRPTAAADRQGTPEAPVEHGWEGEALDDIARHDALRDLGDGRALDFELDRIEPEDIDELDIEVSEADIEVSETVGQLELPTAADEPYDAVDAEDVGAEWLLRATQTTPPMGWNANEAFEGGHVFTPEDTANDDGGREAGYGSDQAGAPLAPHAGTHDEDVAAELPVGTMDASGNVELHAPVSPPDAFGAPPSGELSPTAEELARRVAQTAKRSGH
ncbi:MAG TPA: hypothetical protein VGQ57_10845 [Polyangiaceae bacterium]|nr:hypothetical protein [Polyangiaceae bacterium]